MTSSLFPASTQLLSDPLTVARLAAAADIAIIVLCLLVVAVSVAVLLLMLQLRKLARQATSLVGEVTDKVDPVVERSKVIAQNVEYISASVRSDVERVTGSVQALSDRLQQASDRMEERIEDFNALMEVVQGEAEETFIDTASTVRGVRAGARELASPRSGEGPASPPAPRRTAVTRPATPDGESSTGAP